MSLETIEHVAHPELILKEACRILKPDGVFVCSTPNREVTNPGRRRQDRPRNPFHVFEYNLPEFTQDVTKYFGQVVMYGMNFEPLRKVQIMSLIGHVTPGTFAARLNQALKLPRFIYFDRSYHEVRPIGTFPNTSPEYMVAVCRMPHYDG